MGATWKPGRDGALLVAAVALYALCLRWATAGIRTDYKDGYLALVHTLQLFGRTPQPLTVFCDRAPLQWLLLSPVTVPAFDSGGAGAMVAAAHAAMPLFLAALAGACWLLFLPHLGKRAAALAVLLTAFNPLLLAYAPFVEPAALSALAALLFLACVPRYVERPGAARFGLVLAAYAAAVLSRYHLCFLAVPAALYALLRPGRKSAAAALAFLPALGYAVLVLALGLLYGLAGSGQPFMDAHGMLVNYGATSLFDAPTWSYWHYFESLRLQFGVLGLAAALLGLRRGWTRDGLPRLISLTLVSLLFLLTVLFTFKASRHFVFLMPLVCFAAALGAAPWLSSPRRAGLAVLLLFPWSAARDSLRFLSEEPALRSAAFERLAGPLAGAPAEALISWEGHAALDLPLAMSTVMRREHAPGLTPEAAPLFTGRRVVPADRLPRAPDFVLFACPWDGCPGGARGVLSKLEGGARAPLLELRP